MSVSSKKARARRRREELEGVFPEIDVDHEYPDTGRWLYWTFGGADHLRIEVPLGAHEDGDETQANGDAEPWFYVDGDPVIEGNDDEAAWQEAETRSGALTRLRLLVAHRDMIRMEELAGLAVLRIAATEAGLFGKRETRCAPASSLMRAGC